MSQKYSVRVSLSDGRVAYLSHKNRDQWTLKTAIRYAEEYTAKHGGKATVEPT